MNIDEVDGVKWIEPNHVKLDDLLCRLKNNEAPSDIKNALSITDDNDWTSVARKLFDLWKAEEPHPDGNDLLLANINQKLAPYALSFPVYGTGGEAKEIQTILDDNSPDISKVTKIVFAAVMQPRMRALQLVGRFNKIPLFKEFAYFIDSATVAYYRGNVVAAFLCLIPIIEGILLRWQGYPGRLSEKPDFKKTKNFIGKTIYRQPVPYMPTFVESYIYAADEILKNHLYKKTTDGDAHEDFNRHLALHMLDQKKFYSHDNVMRAFLLLDLLSEIYICEHHIHDPRWNTTKEEESPYEKAYIQALLCQQLPGAPEHILFKHTEHEAAEAIGI